MKLIVIFGALAAALSLAGCQSTNTAAPTVAATAGALSAASLPSPLAVSAQRDPPHLHPRAADSEALAAARDADALQWAAGRLGGRQAGSEGGRGAVSQTSRPGPSLAATPVTRRRKACERERPSAGSWRCGHRGLGRDVRDARARVRARREGETHVTRRVPAPHFSCPHPTAG